MSEFLDNARLSLSSDSFLAVDIGTQGLKVVEVKRKGKNYTLKKAFVIPEMGKFFAGHDILNIKGIVEALSQIANLERTRTKKIILSFTSSKIQSKIISIPEIPEKDLRTFVELEYQKQFPNYNKITDTLDYMPLGKYKKEGSTQNHLAILMALFPSLEGERIIKEFQNKKYWIDSIDVDVHALANVGKIFNAEEKSDIAVFNIGNDTSQIVFLKNDCAVFSRYISFGINNILRAIQSQEDLSLKESEAILEQYGLHLKEDITKGSNAIFAEDYNEIVEGSFTNALNEAYRSFQFVNSTYGLNVSTVLLTGGLANINSAKAIAQKILELDVETWSLEPGESIKLPNGCRIINQSGKTLDSIYATCLGMISRGNFE